MVGVNPLQYDANEFVLRTHMHVLLIVAIINQMLTINIGLQKRNCGTQFLLG